MTTHGVFAAIYFGKLSSNLILNYTGWGRKIIASALLRPKAWRMACIRSIISRHNCIYHSSVGLNQWFLMYGNSGSNMNTIQQQTLFNSLHYYLHLTWMG